MFISLVKNKVDSLDDLSGVCTLILQGIYKNESPYNDMDKTDKQELHKFICSLLLISIPRNQKKEDK